MRISKHTVAVNIYKSNLLPFFMLIESKELCQTVMSIMTPQKILMVQAVIRMKFHFVVVVETMCFLCSTKLFVCNLLI